MDDTERQIETIKAATLKHIPEAEQIYLFGSRAYGTPGADSGLVRQPGWLPNKSRKTLRVLLFLWKLFGN